MCVVFVAGARSFGDSCLFPPRGMKIFVLYVGTTVVATSLPVEGMVCPFGENPDFYVDVNRILYQASGSSLQMVWKRTGGFVCMVVCVSRRGQVDRFSS